MAYVTVIFHPFRKTWSLLFILWISCFTTVFGFFSSFFFQIVSYHVVFVIFLLIIYLKEPIVCISYHFLPYMIILTDNRTIVNFKRFIFSFLYRETKSTGFPAQRHSILKYPLTYLHRFPCVYKISTLHNVRKVWLIIQKKNVWSRPPLRPVRTPFGITGFAPCPPMLFSW